MSSVPEVYFHVGLGKVASTYLQYRLFNKLKNIHYIQRPKFHEFKSVLENSNAISYFASREFDRQLEDEVQKISGLAPQTKYIIVFRKHGDWIASQFRRYVKNGGIKPFEEFFDVKNDSGLWKQKDLYYMPMIEIIEKHSGDKPLVLFNEDLKANPYGFFDKLVNFIGASYNKDAIDLKPSHKSFNDKQLKYLRLICSKYFKNEPKGYENRLKHWLLYRPWWVFYHLILYTSNLLPETWVKDEIIISPDYLEQINEYYQEDWDSLRKYASMEPNYDLTGK